MHSFTLSPAPLPLQEEVQRLHAALQQALKEQAAAARGRSWDLELIAAAPSQLPRQAAGPAGAAGAGGRRASGGSCGDGGAWEPFPGGGAGGRYDVQASSPAYMEDQAGWGPVHSRLQADGRPVARGWADDRQQAADPRASMRPQHPPPAWHDRSLPTALDVRGSYAASSAHDGGFGGAVGRPARCPSPLAPAPGLQQQEQQAWQEEQAWQARGGAATPQQQRASPEAGDQRPGLRTPGSAATSPFATDDTLQARGFAPCPRCLLAAGRGLLQRLLPPWPAPESAPALAALHAPCRTCWRARTRWRAGCRR